MVKGKHVVYTKGAPEILLKKAKFYFHNGTIKKLNKAVISGYLEKRGGLKRLKELEQIECGEAKRP
jgi:hypothetical protein